MANTIPKANGLRARHKLSPEVAAALRGALVESRLSYRQAATRIGISHGYLHDLTRGNRSPSMKVARQLIAVLPLRDHDAISLLGQAVEGRGKDREWDPGPAVPGMLDALRG